MFNGAVHATWYEQIGGLMRIRVAVLQDDEWLLIDGGTDAGLNRDAAMDAVWSRLIVHDGRLFCYWFESLPDETTTIRVAVFSGDYGAPGWAYVDGTLASGLTAAGEGDYASLASFGGRLYAAWRSREAVAFQIRVAVFNGDEVVPAWSFVDRGTAGINVDSSADTYYPKLHVHNDQLHAAWYEKGPQARHTRVAVYNGDDAAPSWSMIDGGEAMGLNFNATRDANGPQLLSHDGDLYGIWHERGAPGNQQVRVIRQSGGSGASSWLFADGATAQGLNRGVDTDAWWGRGVSFNSHLLVAWSENDSGPYRIRLSAYNTDAGEWLPIDSVCGLNRNPNNVAEYPHLVAGGGSFYLAWTERTAGRWLVFVRRADPVAAQ